MRIRDKKANELKDYVGLAISGRCGPLDATNSRKVYCSLFPGANPAWYLRGLEFDPASWDGCDLFCPGDIQPIMLVTERVYLAFTRAKITNMDAIPLSEYTFREADRKVFVNQNNPQD